MGKLMEIITWRNMEMVFYERQNKNKLQITKRVYKNMKTYDRALGPI